MSATLLDILICTLESRRVLFDELHAKLTRQIEASGQVGRVGIRFLRDQKQITVGKKRNILMGMAEAEYTCFVDDDDDVADDYVSMLAKALESQPDCVSLVGILSCPGLPPRQFIHSLQYSRYFEKNGVFYRPPNHLNPIRRDLGLLARFPEKNLGEDTEWAMQLCRKDVLKTEARVEQPYYFYRFDPEKSETQR